MIRALAQVVGETSPYSHSHVVRTRNALTLPHPSSDSFGLVSSGDTIPILTASKPVIAIGGWLLLDENFSTREIVVFWFVRRIWRVIDRRPMLPTKIPSRLRDEVGWLRAECITLLLSGVAS